MPMVRSQQAFSNRFFSLWDFTPIRCLHLRRWIQAIKHPRGQHMSRLPFLQWFRFSAKRVSGLDFSEKYTEKVKSSGISNTKRHDLFLLNDTKTTKMGYSTLHQLLISELQTINFRIMFFCFIQNSEIPLGRLVGLDPLIAGWPPRSCVPISMIIGINLGERQTGKTRWIWVLGDFPGYSCWW